LEDFIASEEIMVKESTIKSTIYYIGMNNEQLNSTIRRAINYAIDYDYLINELFNNTMVRMTSILPPGILYHKDCDVPTLDLNTARQIIIDAGLSKGLTINSPDCDWITLSFTDPIVIANYTFLSYIQTREKIGYSIEEKLRYIGISVSLKGIATAFEFFNEIYINPDENPLFYWGWIPDYNDPSNFLNNLLSNTSPNNIFQVNDPWLEQKMNDSLYEPVESARREMYYQMQEYIATNLMPFAQLGFQTVSGIHSYEIKNLPFPPINKFYFYSCEWDPDTDGDGIIDSKETHIYFTDSNNEDTDNDGLFDGEEINTYLTNPNEVDSDEDTIPDGWEVTHSLNPLSDDASLDIDNDGLSNLDEYIYDTDPNDSDSDDDGLLDGEEILIYGTDPDRYDTDNDNYSDYEEIEEGTNPLSSTSNPGKRLLTILASVFSGTIGILFIYYVIPYLFNLRKKNEEQKWIRIGLQKRQEKSDKMLNSIEKSSK
ncbi:MAG: hypothetical protein KAR08_05980, partial [Candidatus Heimdallarchaeota archaeon]|nr:hypothetical protein [Candidatus Heimdallarchaeota archaeon]